MQRESEQRGRILLVCATLRYSTAMTAEAIAARLRDHGFLVEIGDAHCGMMPPPEDYDGVILAMPEPAGRDARLIAAYIADYRAGLADVPGALFTVSAVAPRPGGDAGGFLAQFSARTGWSPELVAAFGPPSGDRLALQRFADDMARAVAVAAVTAERTEPHLAAP